MRFFDGNTIMFFAKELSSKGPSAVALNPKFSGLIFLQERPEEGTAVVPPAVQARPSRAEPPATNAAKGIEPARAATDLDGFVNSHEPPKTHLFEFLVRKTFTDDADGFRMGLEPLLRDALSLDGLGSPHRVFLPERGLEGDESMDETYGSRLKICRLQSLLSVGRDLFALGFEPVYPLLPCHAFRSGKRDIDQVALNFPRCLAGDRNDMDLERILPAEKLLETFQDVTAVFAAELFMKVSESVSSF